MLHMKYAVEKELPSMTDTAPEIQVSLITRPLIQVTINIRNTKKTCLIYLIFPIGVTTSPLSFDKRFFDRYPTNAAIAAFTALPRIAFQSAEKISNPGWFKKPTTAKMTAAKTALTAPFAKSLTLSRNNPGFRFDIFLFVSCFYFFHGLFCKLLLMTLLVSWSTNRPL